MNNHRTYQLFPWHFLTKISVLQTYW